MCRKNHLLSSVPPVWTFSPCSLPVGYVRKIQMIKKKKKFCLVLPSPAVPLLHRSPLVLSAADKPGFYSIKFTQSDKITQPELWPLSPLTEKAVNPALRRTQSVNPWQVQMSDRMTGGWRKEFDRIRANLGSMAMSAFMVPGYSLHTSVYQFVELDWIFLFALK